MSMKVKIFSHYYSIEELHPLTVREAENRVIMGVIGITGGDVTKAATILGIEKRVVEDRIGSRGMDL
jgi:DNA-binding protein Fis